MTQTIAGPTNTATALRGVLDLHGLTLTREGEDALVDRFADRLVLGGGHALKYLEQDGSEADLTTFLAGLYGNPETKRFFASSGNPIRLPHGASLLTQNPFSKKHWNITKQMLLQRDDPQYAQQLERYAAAQRDTRRDDGDPTNPFSRAGFNLTQQMLLTKNDPERAAMLRREAEDA
jgi:hypothetical protein